MTEHVASFQLVINGPGVGWALESGAGALHNRRSERGLSLLSASRSGLLTTLDVKDHFGSVAEDHLERVLAAVGVAESAEPVLEFIGDLNRVSGVRGLPVGHDGAGLLGHVALVPVDEALLDRGIPFVRWMDDLWVFPNTASDAQSAEALVSDVLDSGGMKLNATKTATLNGTDARNAIKNRAIASALMLVHAGDEDASTKELFRWAASDPWEHPSELRYAIGGLTKRALRPFPWVCR